MKRGTEMRKLNDTLCSVFQRCYSGSQRCCATWTRAKSWVDDFAGFYLHITWIGDLSAIRFTRGGLGRRARRRSTGLTETLRTRTAIDLFPSPSPRSVVYTSLFTVSHIFSRLFAACAVSRHGGLSPLRACALSSPRLMRHTRATTWKCWTRRRTGGRLWR